MVKDNNYNTSAISLIATHDLSTHLSLDKFYSQVVALTSNNICYSDIGITILMFGFCSCIIPLPQEFVEYLQDNGTLVMPKDVTLRQASADQDLEEESWDDGPEKVLLL